MHGIHLLKGYSSHKNENSVIFSKQTCMIFFYAKEDFLMDFFYVGNQTVFVTIFLGQFLKYVSQKKESHGFGEREFSAK